MENFDIYKDIAERTNGDIYVGVVGAVRTGKSTFITKFMEALVLPNIQNVHKKERAKDELPQAAAGKTIMTTQPKFVPNEGISIAIRDKVEVKVRLCDCVGYMIEGAQGHKEGGKARLVKTPWADEEMTFEAAAELGTKKVIAEHSTIGVVMTSDGTINTDIPRQSYIKAEERVIKELKAINKPFIVVLNTTKPLADETAKLRDGLAEKYDVPVMAVDALNMKIEDINCILEKVLFEFPLRMVEIEMPQWMQALPADNLIIKSLMEQTRAMSDSLLKMRDFADAHKFFEDSEYIEPVEVNAVRLGEGKLVFDIRPKEGLFYKVLSSECGCEIQNDFHLMSYVKQATHAKAEYDKLKNALDEVKETGYGVVVPGMSDMSLEDPEIVRQGNRFGVRLKASAPSLHIMRVDIETEVNPIVGTEQQSEELVKYLLSEFESDPKGIWNTNMFGKSLHMLVNENLSGKVHSMPAEAQKKMRRTLQRIVNEGRGGIICILL